MCAATPSSFERIVMPCDGAVVAVVDIGNAGSGTRATDLTTLVWYTFQDPLLDGVRGRLWTRILDLVGWQQAAVLTATQILLMLELPIRHERHAVVPGVVERGHRALDELNALRWLWPVRCGRGGVARDSALGTGGPRSMAGRGLTSRPREGR